MTSPFPKKNNQKVYDWLFGALIMVLVIFKFNDLFLPYFWDELGVYSQAAAYQYHHGLSLMPASVPVIISRGHPLFFTFINAIVFKIFGCNVAVAHSFNLLISIILLLVMYVYITKNFNRLTALICVALLAAQPTFLSQSCLVIPEITLALLIFLALANYFEEKFFAFAVFGSFALLTKESAIVVPATVILFSGIRWLVFRDNTASFKPHNLLLTVFPYLIFGLFLITQKIQNGWYFFPYHIDNVLFDLGKSWKQFRAFFDFIWWVNGRYWWMKCLLVGLGIGIITNQINRETIRKNFLYLGITFGFAFITFSSMSFYMERYMMAALVISAILTGVSVVILFRNKYLAGVVTGLLCLVGLQHLEDGAFHNDSDLGYRRQVTVLKQAMDYLTDVSNGEKVFANFPGYYALNFVDGGYMKDSSRIKSAMALDFNSGYYLRCLPCTESVSDFKDYDCALIKTFRDGYAEAEVYKMKRKQLPQ